MELIAAVAIGLNPYVGAFVVAALAAWSGRVPVGDFGALVPNPVVAVAAILLGLAMPVDFVLSKFVRFAPSVRRASQFVAPVAGAFFTACITRSDLPLAAVASGWPASRRAGAPRAAWRAPSAGRPTCSTAARWRR